MKDFYIIGCTQDDEEKDCVKVSYKRHDCDKENEVTLTVDNSKLRKPETYKLGDKIQVYIYNNALGEEFGEEERWCNGEVTEILNPKGIRLEFKIRADGHVPPHLPPSPAIDTSTRNLGKFVINFSLI